MHLDQIQYRNFFSREFGSKVITVKPLMKKIRGFLEDGDEGVRDGGKALAVEIYR